MLNCDFQRCRNCIGETLPKCDMVFESYSAFLHGEIGEGEQIAEHYGTGLGLLFGNRLRSGADKDLTDLLGKI